MFCIEMKSIRKVVLMFCLLSITVLSYAQDDDEYSSQGLSYKAFHNFKLYETGSYTFLDTLWKKPTTYIMTDSGKYYIAYKPKGQWVIIELETQGTLQIDSTRRVNLNDEGSDELVLYTEYFDATETDGELDQEWDELTHVYIIDQDRKLLIMDFVFKRFYKKVETFYTDSTGAIVDPSSRRHDVDYMESLNKDADVKHIRTNCDYVLEKNRITLVCKGEKKEFGGETQYTEATKSVYDWKDGEWRLLKK